MRSRDLPSFERFKPTRTPLLAFGSHSATLEMCSGASFSRIPLSLPAARALVWRLMKFTFSTVTVHFLRFTARTRPSFGLPGSPFESPESTTTVSPFLMANTFLDGSGFFFFTPTKPPRPSDDFGRERNDLHELAFPEFAGHRTEDAGPARLLVVVDQHHGFVVEADVRAILASTLLDRAHDHR